MIELRWYCLWGPNSGVLEFRTIVNFQEIGLQDPIWSEWEEVPKHFAELNVKKGQDDG